MDITVTRNAYRFKVEDGPITSPWKFWLLWSEGRWEADLFDQMDRLLHPDSVLFDIGAWVGPMTLWATVRNRARVFAFEPDPVAFADLVKNIELNDVQDRVNAYEAAAWFSDGETTLYNPHADGWGSSGSSQTCLTPYQRQVATIDIRPLLQYERPDLVKMDIEGGESLLFPAIGPILRSMNVPILLSLHPYDYAPNTVEAMEEELAHWKTYRLTGTPGIDLLCALR